jgi:hypothetical protein
MAKYTVTEIVDYEIEADSAEEAEEILAGADNPDIYFKGLRSRAATHVGTPPTFVRGPATASIFTRKPQ